MARRQTLATLGATALEDQPTGLRAHPFSESVSFRAAAIVGLKCPFHNSCSLIASGGVIEKRETNNRPAACQAKTPMDIGRKRCAALV